MSIRQKMFKKNKFGYQITQNFILILNRSSGFNTMLLRKGKKNHQKVVKTEKLKIYIEICL